MPSTSGEDVFPLWDLPDSFLFGLFSPPKEKEMENTPVQALEHLYIDRAFELASPSIWVRVLSCCENATVDVSHPLSLYRVAFLARRKPEVWREALSNPSFGLSFDGHPALLADLLPRETVARTAHLSLNPYNWFLAPEARYIDLIIAADEPLPDLLGDDFSPPPVNPDAAVCAIERLLELEEEEEGTAADARPLPALALTAEQAPKRVPVFHRLRCMLGLLGIDVRPVIRREITLAISPRSPEGAALHLFAFLREHGPSLRLKTLRSGFSVPLAWTDPDGVSYHLAALLPRPEEHLILYESDQSLNFFPPTLPLPGSPALPKFVTLHLRSPPSLDFARHLALYLAPSPSASARNHLESLTVNVGCAVARAHDHDFLQDPDLNALFAEVLQHCPAHKVQQVLLSVKFDPHTTRDLEKPPEAPAPPPASPPRFLELLPAVQDLEAPLTPSLLASVPLLAHSLRTLSLTPQLGLGRQQVQVAWEDLAALSRLTSLNIECAFVPAQVDPLKALPTLQILDLTPVHNLTPAHAAVIVSFAPNLKRLTLSEARTATYTEDGPTPPRPKKRKRPEGGKQGTEEGKAEEPQVPPLDFRPLSSLTYLELVYPGTAECPVLLPPSLRLLRCEGEGSTAAFLAARLQKMLVLAPNSLRRVELHINREFAALQFKDAAVFKTAKLVEWLAATSRRSLMSLHLTLCLSMENVGQQVLRPLSKVSSQFLRLRTVEVAHNGATDGLRADQFFGPVSDMLRESMGEAVMLRLGYEQRSAAELALERI